MTTATEKTPPTLFLASSGSGAWKKLLALVEAATIGCCIAGSLLYYWSSGMSHTDLTVWVIVLVGAVVSSIAGFAFAAIGGAMLFHVAADKIHALQVILVASIALQTYCVWKMRRAIEPKSLATYFAGGITTILPGIYLFLHTPIAIYLVSLGVFLILYATFMLTRPPLRVSRDSAAGRFLAGALGGITGATAAFPGAFVTIWCGAQGWDKQRQRAVYQPFILGMQLLTFAALAIANPGPAFRLEILHFAVPAVLGAYIGMRLFERLSTGQFNQIVGGFLLISGFSLVLKGL